MENVTTFAPEDVQANKAIAVLANIPGLFWLPLVAAKGSPFAMFYCNQGFWLFIVCVAASILAYIPFLGWLVSLALWVAMVVFMIIGMIGASKGEAKEVPLLGKTVVLR